MSLPLVILTQIAKQDKTGYFITKSFATYIGTYWRASHQQVYRELAKLEANGMLTHVVEPQDGKPDRKVYSITKQGKELYLEMATSFIPMETLRDSAAAHVAATTPETIDETILVLEEYLSNVKAIVEQIKIEKIRIEEKKPSFDNMINLIAVNRGDAHWKAINDWILSAIKSLKEYKA